MQNLIPNTNKIDILDTKSISIHPKWKEWMLQLNLTTIEPFQLELQQAIDEVLIFPGSGSLKKNWPLDSYIRILEPINNHYKLHVVFGPAELEREMDHLWAQRGPGKIYKMPSFDQLIHLFESHPYYIGNDSGFSHLAGIYQLPGIVFFQASSKQIWRPQGNSLHLLGDQSKPVSIEEATLSMNTLFKN